ncbi:MAG: hypothetical protein OEW75_04260 [Cyclobacteriaceae bacterium]|nr:hypothetical protein [Cyclobacteriaceae bacterium]
MKLRNSLFVLAFLMLLAGCMESEYSRLVKRELNSEVRYDSLFLTFSFGDQRRNFFSKGWIQNSEGLIKQGPNNQNVEYLMGEAKKGSSQIRMLFYPRFTEEDHMYIMDLSFEYLGWFPTTDKFNSENLLPVIKDTLMNWYGGNSFIKVSLGDETEEDLWVKVDGNRQITLRIIDEQTVEGKMEDLSIKYKDKL